MCSVGLVVHGNSSFLISVFCSLFAEQQFLPSFCDAFFENSVNSVFTSPIGIFKILKKFELKEAIIFHGNRKAFEIANGFSM